MEITSVLHGINAPPVILAAVISSFHNGAVVIESIAIEALVIVVASILAKIIIVIHFAI